MNKTELIAAVAEQAELSKKDAEKALDVYKRQILDCRVEDVMEIVFDENEEPLWSPGLEEERQKEKDCLLYTSNRKFMED